MTFFAVLAFDDEVHHARGVFGTAKRGYYL